MTKKEQWVMSKSPKTIILKDVEDGTQITPIMWCVYVDDEKEVEILSIMDKDGSIYACQSDTFKKNFFEIVTLFGNEEYTIEKVSGMTKAGREFIDCSLAL